MDHGYCGRHARRHETPFSHDWQVFEATSQRHWDRLRRRPGHAKPRIPETELQALMEAGPGQTPATTLAQTSELRAPIVDAIDALDNRSRWIFEAHVYRQLSFGDIATELSLSKTHVYRIYQKARKQLQDRLKGLIDE